MMSVNCPYISILGKKYSLDFMTRLTEVRRGQAIALLMQGQRQQQVALEFGVNVSTIERLVGRLRDTGRVADRQRRGKILLL
jgi:transposase